MDGLKLQFQKRQDEGGAERWVLRSASYQEQPGLEEIRVTNGKDYDWDNESGVMALAVFFLRCALKATEIPNRHSMTVILSSRDCDVARAVGSLIDRTPNWIKKLFGPGGLDFIKRGMPVLPENPKRRSVELSLKSDSARLSYYRIAILLSTAASPPANAQQLSLVLDSVVEQWKEAHQRNQDRVKPKRSSDPTQQPSARVGRVRIHYGLDQRSWVADHLRPSLIAARVEVELDMLSAGEGFETISMQENDMSPVANRVEVFVFSADLARQGDLPTRALSEPGDGKMLAVLRPGGVLPTGDGEFFWKCIDFRDDREPQDWAELLEECGADPSMQPLDWFAERDQIRRHLQAGDNVNLVTTDPIEQWLPLVETLATEERGPLAIVDLYSPSVATRRGLIGEIIARILHCRKEVPASPHDLPFLSETLDDLPRPPQLVILHGDMLQRHDYKDDVPLFAALHSLTTETPADRQRLVLLVHSRDPIAKLFPKEHKISSLAFKSVRLPGDGGLRPDRPVKAIPPGQPSTEPFS